MDFQLFDLVVRAGGLGRVVVSGRVSKVLGVGLGLGKAIVSIMVRIGYMASVNPIPNPNHNP